MLMGRRLGPNSLAIIPKVGRIKTILIVQIHYNKVTRENLEGNNMADKSRSLTPPKPKAPKPEEVRVNTITPPKPRVVPSKPKSK